jgi:hypothetical protein
VSEVSQRVLGPSAEKHDGLEDFRDKIATTLRQAERPLTWTEIRTSAGLPQLYPNNQWVRRRGNDIGLRRTRDAGGIIHWQVIAGVGVLHESPIQIVEASACPP